MDALFDGSLDAPHLALLLVALLVACAFEFVNGFHDTANAVATVIYSHSLRPWTAVIWSGIWNFLGVFAGGIAVAISIIKLLPSELLVQGGTGSGLAMVLALLVAAVLWNLGTWWLGLPASSSHTLIGAILGVGVANSLLPGHVFGAGVNWGKAGGVFISLLVSPLFGLAAAGFLLWAALRLFPSPRLHRPPPTGQPPPLGVRALLIGTCTGVSFAHGSNDGQKGVGLMMLILIGLMPAAFALDPSADATRLERSAAASGRIQQLLTTAGVEEVALGSSNPAGAVDGTGPVDVRAKLAWIEQTLQGVDGTQALSQEDRWEVRKQILLVDAAVDTLVKGRESRLGAAEKEELKAQREQLRGITDYAPLWVLVLVALSLGFGTMVGWKRIVVTVGERIGKTHLTYAQGAAAELVAASTIGFAALAGLPVSTTHVLSSGIAGTMLVQGSGLQGATVRKIASAWLLTLPASATLSAVLFLIFRALFV